MTAARQNVGHFLLCLPCPPAPPLSRTPSWGREFGSLRTHWRENAKRLVNLEHLIPVTWCQLAKGPFRHGGSCD